MTPAKFALVLNAAQASPNFNDIKVGDVLECFSVSK